MKKIASQLKERVAKLIRSMGYDLVGCEFISQQQIIFRVYIDSSKGVTVEDCSLVSQQLSALLDVEDFIQNRYRLEVSSPGIDRPLFELEQYHQFIGRQVKIRLHSPINQRKQYQGVLQKVEGENICLLVHDLNEEVTLPFSAIEKANLIGDVHFR